MAAEAQIYAIGTCAPVPWVISTLNILVALHLSRVLYKSTLFMQNKPNLLDTQMNVGSVKTKYYENVPLCRRGENKPKQTQSNPIFKQSAVRVRADRQYAERFPNFSIFCESQRKTSAQFYPMVFRNSSLFPSPVTQSIAQYFAGRFYKVFALSVHSPEKRHHQH